MRPMKTMQVEKFENVGFIIFFENLVVLVYEDELHHFSHSPLFQILPSPQTCFDGLHRREARSCM